MFVVSEERGLDTVLGWEDLVPPKVKVGGQLGSGTRLFTARGVLGLGVPDLQLLF